MEASSDRALSLSSTSSHGEIRSIHHEESSSPLPPALAPAKTSVVFPAAVVAAVRKEAAGSGDGAGVVAGAAGVGDGAANNGRQGSTSVRQTKNKTASTTKGAKDSRARQNEQKVCENELRAELDPDILAEVEAEGGITPAGRLIRAAARHLAALKRELAQARGEAEEEDDDEDDDEDEGENPIDEMEVDIKEEVVDDQQDDQQDEAGPRVDDPREVMDEMRMEMEQNFAAIWAEIAALKAQRGQ